MKRRVIKKKWNREVKDLKKDLKRSNCSIDGIFTSFEYYDDTEEFTWSDIYFIGTYEGRQRVFNCTIVSSIDALEELVDDIVSEEMDKHYPDRYENRNFEFKETSESEENKQKLYELDFSVKNEDLQKEINKKEEHVLKDVLNNRDISIKPHIKSLPDYNYGVGIEIVTEEKFLTKQIVIDYVKKAQQLNIIENKEIYFSDKEIKLTPEDREKALKHKSRLINV